MMNNEIFPIYEECISTLKEISYDDSNCKYLCECENKIINFDNVKRKYVSNLKLSEKVCKSVDGLYIDSRKNVKFFVEFKNGKNLKGKGKELIAKAKDSLLLLCDIENTNISKTRVAMEYIVVYNEEHFQSTKSKNMILDNLMKKGKQEFIRFGLEEYEGMYFKNIHTYTVDEFCEYFKKIIS